MDYSEKSVLVVDDVASVRTYIIEALTELGFREIFQASSGDEAWKTLLDLANIRRGKTVDIIFSDINMKFGTGLGLLKKVRKDPNFFNIPFIVITTMNEKEAVLKAVDLGVSSYIVKPFEPDTVKARVEELLPAEKEEADDGWD